MVDVAVEVIRPFVFSYPVKGEIGDFVEDRLVPGPDGHLIKRPVAFKKIEGFVEYARANEKGEQEIITRGTGAITLPKEQADILIARGVVRPVGRGARPVEEEDPLPPEPATRRGRNRPVPLD